MSKKKLYEVSLNACYSEDGSIVTLIIADLSGNPVRLDDMAEIVAAFLEGQADALEEDKAN